MFDLPMNLIGRLAQQEESSQDQDDVLAGKASPEYCEQRLVQLHHKTDRQNQNRPGDNGQSQPYFPRIVALRFGQLTRQNRNEDHVVDPQYDLERSQREQRDERFRRKEIHHCFVALFVQKESRE